jgi:translation initiation factor IF-2
MSTKDLLEKLKRTSATTTRRRAGGRQPNPGTSRATTTTAETGGAKEGTGPGAKSKTDTRVSKRVIRRKSSSQNAQGDSAGSGHKSTGGAKSASNKAPTGRRIKRRRVIRRRPSPSQEAAAKEAAAKEAAAKAASSESTAPDAAASSPAGKKSSEESFQQMGLGSAVIGLPEGYKTPAQRKREAEAARQQAAEAARIEAENNAQVAASAAKQRQAEEIARAQRTEEAENAVRVTASQQGDSEAAPESAAPEATPAAAAGPASAAPKPARPSSPVDPRVARQARFKKMGLGSAVIGLPEGYDPKNPRGHLKSSQPAANQPAANQAGTRSQPGPRRERVFGKREDSGGARRDGGGRDSRGRGGRRVVGGNALSRGYKKKSGRKRRSGPKKVSPQAKAIKRRVIMQNDSITVGEFSHAMSVKASQVIRSLFGMGLKVRINDNIDIDTARLISEEFEYEVVDGRFDEDAHLIDVEADVVEEGLEHRDPVITIMGHVDHGKTTLLDTIRRARVADGEAGGITQHVSAYQTKHNNQTITFIDTPGHEAFTQMRARGAKVTDIVILVVAADDGVMPQTVEALSHAKAAGVPIIVAINKCDKPDSNPGRVRQELMQYELVPEEFGGDTIFVEVSALKNMGIDDLLENILLLAEVQEFQANPDRHAQGYVLEARIEKGRGAVATLLVKKGTLKQGDSVVLGTVWGRVRAMSDYNGKRIKQASPSMPVEIIGLQDVPNAGDEFVVTESDKDARALADHRVEKMRQAEVAASNQPVSLEQLIRQKQEGEKLILNLILRSDVGGTLEAMKASLAKIAVPGTDVKILHSSVGAVSEGDITLAHTYNGIIIGFNVRPDSKARRAMADMGVEVRTYRVIYEALEDVEKALKGMLEPETKEVTQGYATLKQTFGVPKIGTVAGCLVTEGKIARNQKIRLLRQGEIIWDGRLASLRRFKDDVREVLQGYECGMNLDGFNDLKVGDEIEGYVIEEVARDL